MCVASKQPKAPINRPAYAPDEAHKHFTYENEVDEKPASEETAQASPATGPKIKPRHDNIRM